MTLPRFQHLPQCACGEVHPSAITLVRPRGSEGGGRYVCGNCLGRQRGLREGLCVTCGKIEPCHYHHKDGRAVSDITDDRCVNCHQKFHRGRSVERIKRGMM
jgi:hypothetical protein